MVPPVEFLSPFGTPKEARKTGQSVTLAKVSLWPKCHSGQSVTGQNVTSQSDTGQTVSPAKVSLAKVSLAKRSLCPKCHSGQTVPAKLSLAKVSFWPKCDSAVKLYAVGIYSCKIYQYGLLYSIETNKLVAENK